MEGLTKREWELIEKSVLQEATRLNQYLTEGDLLPAHRRIVREEKNELLEIMRKVLTNKTSM